MVEVDGTASGWLSITANVKRLGLTERIRARGKDSSSDDNIRWSRIGRVRLAVCCGARISSSVTTALRPVGGQWWRAYRGDHWKLSFNPQPTGPAMELDDRSMTGRKRVKSCWRVDPANMRSHLSNSNLNQT